MEFNFDGEDLLGMAEMGRMGLAVYRGVVLNGGEAHEAFAVTAAFFAGAIKGSMDGTNFTPQEPSDD